MSFENTAHVTRTTAGSDNQNLLPSEISGPTGTSTASPRNWLEHPVTLTAAAALGGAYGRELIPQSFDLLSSHQFARGGRWSNATGTLGSDLFGEGSAIASSAPRVNFTVAENAVNEVSRAGLQPLAKAWNANRLVPGAAQEMAAGAESTTAAATEALSGMTRFRVATAGMIDNAGSYLAARPNLASAGRAALLIGGAAMADNYFDSNGYHLAVPGMAVGMMAREGLLAPAAVGLGALAISKALGPANADIERITRPGMSDTMLLAGAASLPLKGEAQAYALGGAYVMGRMAHMNSGEAAVTSGAVGLAAYAKTHNPYVAVAAGASSYIGSRALGWMG
ncbi:MAG TPA: hypothetical protein V6C69_00775 [Trichormus sp.]|jgi:hypothetical protein